MATRRDFLKTAVMAAAGSGFAADAAGKGDIRAVLLHAGRNMWGDWRPEDEPKETNREYAADHVRFDESVWRALTARMVERRMNMVVIDLGEFMIFPSHPELAVKGSWDADRMRAEVRRLRGMGLEPIPKLNFSTTHDPWLKIYHRMVSTPRYYQVVRDVIRDAAEAFERPRFFHLGFDEEVIGNQGGQSIVCLRQGELWWHDFLYTIRCAEEAGSRAWVWSDYGWHHPDYYTRCPKSVLQSNWYYDEANGNFSLDGKVNSDAYRLQAFHDLEKAGFDQIPCGTNWVGWKRRQAKVGADDVIGKLVPYCRKAIAPERLKGFLMAPWSNCEGKEGLEFNTRGIDLFAACFA